MCEVNENIPLVDSWDKAVSERMFTLFSKGIREIFGTLNSALSATIIYWPHLGHLSSKSLLRIVTNLYYMDVPNAVNINIFSSGTSQRILWVLWQVDFCLQDSLQCAVWFKTQMLLVAHARRGTAEYIFGSENSWHLHSTLTTKRTRTKIKS